MADGILPIPPIPQPLRDAAQRGTLIPFVGAGASVLAGCPTWAQLADGALRACIDANKFTYAQLAQIEHLSPRVKLSIARSLWADLRERRSSQKRNGERARGKRRECDGENRQ